MFHSLAQISQRGRAATKNREGAMARRPDAKKNFLATKNTENLFWILEFGFWIYFLRGFVASWLRGEKSSWRSWRLGGSMVSVADAPEIFASREERSGLWHRFKNIICEICAICG
jgi:hypothetical protein